MIIWVNCKITDVPLNSSPLRFNLRKESRFDIARYTFASYAALDSLTSKIIFNLELGNEFLNRKEEMENWIKSLFPPEKLSISWYRCNNLTQWKEVQTVINNINDDLLYLAGNDDHVFFDNSLDLYKKGLNILDNDPDEDTALVNCHYPESLREALNHPEHQLTDCKNFVSIIHRHSIGIVVIKKALYNRFLSKVTDPDKIMFRMDDWQIDGYTKIFIPTKEISKHFDGYSHVNIDPNVCPPLEIPPGFFEKNVTIRYGFDDYDPECVNINPLSTNLHAIDPNGADYKFCLNDIPIFWRPFIKRIVIATELDSQKMFKARNQHYIDLSSPVFFGKKIEIPQVWIENHLV
jgi:hypothetical protein